MATAPELYSVFKLYSVTINDPKYGARTELTCEPWAGGGDPPPPTFEVDLVLDRAQAAEYAGSWTYPTHTVLDDSSGFQPSELHQADSGSVVTWRLWLGKSDADEATADSPLFVSFPVSTLFESIYLDDGYYIRFRLPGAVIGATYRVSAGGNAPQPQAPFWTNFKACSEQDPAEEGA